MNPRKTAVVTKFQMKDASVLEWNNLRLSRTWPCDLCVINIKKPILSEERKCRSRTCDQNNSIWKKENLGLETATKTIPYEERWISLCRSRTCDFCVTSIKKTISSRPMQKENIGLNPVTKIIPSEERWISLEWNTCIVKKENLALEPANKTIPSEERWFSLCRFRACDFCFIRIKKATPPPPVVQLYWH